MGFRISSKNFLLTYPKKQTVEGQIVEIDTNKIKAKLTKIFQGRSNKRFMLSQESSDQEVPYEHFHVYINLEKKKNITSPSTLDIERIHGNYLSARKPKEAIQYLCKDGKAEHIVGSIIDDELDKIKEPFKKFCCRIEFKKENLLKLLEEITHLKKYDQDMFDMKTDFLKRPEPYFRAIRMNTEENFP